MIRVRRSAEMAVQRRRSCIDRVCSETSNSAVGRFRPRRDRVWRLAAGVVFRN